MRNLLVAIFIAGLMTSCSEVSKGSGKNAKIETLVDSVSYCMGLNVGGFINSVDTELNYDLFEKAVEDLKNGEETVFSPEEAQQILQMLGQKLYGQSVEKNRKAGLDFLAQNTDDGIVTLESGLQYEVLEEGSGPKPTLNDKVLCHYKGTFIDGTEFDSSYERGEPTEFPVGGVIKGWTEALQLMSVGSKWKIYVPSELGYGENPPRGSNIKPGSVLIFEMELLEILGGSAETAPAE